MNLVPESPQSLPFQGTLSEAHAVLENVLKKEAQNLKSTKIKIS